MNKLIKLELKKQNIHSYVKSTIIITAIMLCILYFFAFIPTIEADDNDISIFLNYKYLIPMFSVLNMTVFSILSAVMHSKFLVEDYSEKKIILLFTYPIDRKKIILSKLFVVSIFTVIAMIISNAVIFVIFGISEQFFHIVNDKFTFYTFFQSFFISIFMAVISASIGTISARIGFLKKSVPATIVSSILAASILCNIVANMPSNKLLLYVIAVIILIVGMVCSYTIMRKADVMDIE